ncbi:MAG TPA: hypothetical protein VFG47_04945, partial [Geminicoccaceae bacterium]|nr:hypothetical protein [Geminicoccaceae bacterium]
GTESEFAELMTRKARGLGMERTTFRNASGLHHPGQLSTARDMARLSRALLTDFPQYYDYFSRPEFRYAGRTYHSHNHLLRTYAGADGIKTGYIRPSGFNLASSAVRNGRRLIGVVFGGRTAQSRDQHMAELLDGGFARLPALVASAPEVGPSPPNPRHLTAFVVASVLAEPIEPTPAKPILPATGPVAAKPAIDVPQAVVAEGDGGDTVIAVAQADASREQKSGQYGVQVGAYYDADLAKRAATRAVERLPHILVDTRVAISRVRGQRGWIYRGRLVGLTLGRANEACRLLRSKKQDCLVVRAGEAVDVALRG